MAIILPTLRIDSEKIVSKHFLDYQCAWIFDQSRMMLAEKSVRIGWTYCDAFRNVRKRIAHKDRDYLFATKDQASAIEYLTLCKKFIQLFGLAASVISSGEDSVKVKNADGITEEIKFCYIKFQSGSRIIAFSASPMAMAVYGGDVGLDEFAKAQQADLLWETAQGRVTWGYDIAAWSSHNGTDTLFYQFSREAAAGKGGWSHYRVTMEDAVEHGLLEKINARSPKALTPAEFIADCKNRARLPEIYEQAYNCNPSGSVAAIVPWSTVCQCRRDYQIERLHLEAHQVKELFGPYNPDSPAPRREAIRSHILSAFPRLFAASHHRRLGFDVAASGQGDLCCIYIEEKEATAQKLEALFTCRTDDWDAIEQVLWTFLSNLGSVKAAGDETGLGKQICWRTAKRFPNFTGINFSREKHDMGHAMMNQLAMAEKIFPTGEDDIAQDFFSMRKTFSGGRWIFSEGRNNLNPSSHCDIAWAGALATRADASAATGAFTSESLAGVSIQPITGPARFLPRLLKR